MPGIEAFRQAPQPTFAEVQTAWLHDVYEYGYWLALYSMYADVPPPEQIVL